MTVATDQNQQRFIRARNTGGTDIPAFGCVEVTGSTLEDDGVVMQVRQATTDNPANVAFTSNPGIAAGETGLATLDTPALCLFDAAATPASGDRWGVVSGSFKLTESGSGFIVLGEVDASAGTVRVVKATSGDTAHKFTLTENMGATTANQASATRLDFLTGVSTGETITVKDTTPGKMWEPLTNGTSGECIERDGEYRIIEAECAKDGGSFYIEMRRRQMNWA